MTIDLLIAKRRPPPAKFFNTIYPSSILELFTDYAILLMGYFTKSYQLGIVYFLNFPDCQGMNPVTEVLE